MFSKIVNSARQENPLIHCITNPISINQCANAILATGGKPIMAEHPMEVREITEKSHALVLNLGNITDVRMESMLISAKTANEKNIPFIIDLVGIACSRLRRNYSLELLKYHPTAIKGNYSEIMALYDSTYKSSGVDADFSDINQIKDIAAKLAQKYKCIILASGETDIVTDDKNAFSVKNGTPLLAKVTGTGCMLGALCGYFLSVSADISGVLTACGVLGISGERAHTDKGNGTFLVNLMDNLCKDFDEEEFRIEKI